jgi:hypoxanthine phosphoribosyltransferase
MTPHALQPLLSAEAIRARVLELGRRIAADHPDAVGGPPLHLVGILKGSFVFLSDLARAVPRDVLLDFVGVASYGAGTESSGAVRITKDLEADIEGADVILVEDIVDSGRTLRFVLDRMLARRPRSLKVAALLDKPGRRVVPVEADYVGFEIPDVFVVGYGLDHAGRYRNLPDIRQWRGA